MYFSIHCDKMQHFPRVFPTAALKQPVKARQHTEAVSQSNCLPGRQRDSSIGPPLTWLYEQAYHFYQDDSRLRLCPHNLNVQLACGKHKSVISDAHLQPCPLPTQRLRSFPVQSVHWQGVGSHSLWIRLSGLQTRTVGPRSLQVGTETQGMVQQMILWLRKLLQDCLPPSHSGCHLHCWQQQRWRGSDCSFSTPSHERLSASGGPGVGLNYHLPGPHCHCQCRHRVSLPPDWGRGWQSYNWMSRHHSLFSPAVCGQSQSPFPGLSPCRMENPPASGQSWVAWDQKWVKR